MISKCIFIQYFSSVSDALPPTLWLHATVQEANHLWITVAMEIPLSRARRRGVWLSICHVSAYRWLLNIVLLRRETSLHVPWSYHSFTLVRAVSFRVRCDLGRKVFAISNSFMLLSLARRHFHILWLIPCALSYWGLVSFPSYPFFDSGWVTSILRFLFHSSSFLASLLTSRTRSELLLKFWLWCLSFDLRCTTFIAQFSLWLSSP